MSEKEKNNKPRGDFRNHARKEKKPQLTHFLCLPLVNSVSLPQLESSLATFRATIPVSPSSSPAAQRERDQNGLQEALIEHKPLIPDGALRPIGTIHLTLGVMSLPTKERLNEALEFFRSLDLGAIIYEAEDKTRSRSGKGRVEQLPRESSGEFDSAPSVISQDPFFRRPQPFNVSLESLHALPRARSATVLHAAPVDPTSRLYPFCEILRDRFLEAGFLLGENKDSQRQEQSQGEAKDESSRQDQDQKNQQPAANQIKALSISDTPVNDVPSSSSSLLEELPINLAEEQAQLRPPRSITKPVHTPKSKPRPLLLHATVVNTIYIKDRPRRHRGGGKNNFKNNSRYTFDARDMLDHYRDYYLDGHRTTPRSAAMTVASTSTGAHDRETPLPPADMNSTLLHDSNAGQEPDDDAELKKRKRPQGSMNQDSNNSNSSTVKNPFIWAKDFPLESVCICEMGAKKLDPSDDGLNTRLGEKYKVVEERSLSWDDNSSIQPATQTESSQVPDGGRLTDASSDGSSEGGVRIPG